MFSDLKHIHSTYRRFCLSILAAILCVCAPFAHAQFGDNPFSVSVELQNENPDGATLALDFTVPANHYLSAAHLRVALDGDTFTPRAAPKPKAKVDPFSGDEVRAYDHDFQLLYNVSPDAQFPQEVTVDYQGCSETLCFMPQTETFQVSPAAVTVASEVPVPDAPVNDELLAGFQITGRDSGFKKPAEFIAFIDRVEAGEGVSENIIQTVSRKYGILVMVLFVLLGGFMLNLTPCVLPMIPVNIAIIGAGTQAGSRSRGFALGATYGLGISFVYGVLGVVVVLTGSQFGTLNASPWFNLAIAALFVVLALAMFGIFNIDFSRFQSGGSERGAHGPFITAFAFGGVAALLAGACVAPILIGVLLFSTEVYQRGTAAGLLLPFVLGLGMALPWPFAGAGLSFLPKPGRWMERIKIGFGIVILAAAAYYGMLGVRLLAPQKAEKEAVPDATADFAWITSLDEALATSQANGKPVFVDVWATWCKSCKAMSKTTFQDAGVVARLKNYVPLKYQAEEPKDPETKRVLDALGVKGQPFYVVLEPR
jgi:thiol:disulfide interchange protein DsbD